MNEWNLPVAEELLFGGKAGEKVSMGGVKKQVLLDLQLYNCYMEGGSELLKGENENEVPCGGVGGGRI